MSTSTNLYLDDETRKRLDSLAKHFETSKSAVARLAVKRLHEQIFGFQVNPGKTKEASAPADAA